MATCQLLGLFSVMSRVLQNDAMRQKDLFLLVLVRLRIIPSLLDLAIGVDCHDQICHLNLLLFYSNTPKLTLIKIVLFE